MSTDAATQNIQLPPSKICFSHDSINGFFHHRGHKKPILETLDDILNGFIDVNNLPKIHVVRSGDKFFVLSGNRRLYVYRALEQAGFLSNVEAIRHPLEKVREELDKKMTTTCNGETVEVRTGRIADFSWRMEKILRKYTSRPAQDDDLISDSEDESEHDTTSDEEDEPEPPNGQHLSQQPTTKGGEDRIEDLRSNLRAAQADCSQYCSVIQRCKRKLDDLGRESACAGQALSEADEVGQRVRRKYNVKKMRKMRRRDAKQRFVHHFAVAGAQWIGGKSSSQPKPNRQQSARRLGGPAKRERTMDRATNKAQQTIAECNQSGAELQGYLAINKEKRKTLLMKLRKAKQDLEESRAKIRRYQEEICNTEDDKQDGEVICCIRFLFVEE